jgi:2-methylcitrate dehydratase
MTTFDSTLQHIAEYTTSIGPGDLTPAVSDGLVRHHLDSIGCALGGYRTPIARTALAIAASANSDSGASVIGVPHRTAPEYAAFANATLIRFLDFNDGYLANGGGHTSDIIAAVFAAAEQRDRSGVDFLVALHVGYEVFTALADAVSLRDRGWDYPLHIGIAAAAATAKAMGLATEQVANAVSMAITPSIPLGITRVGPLANWKGLAAPFAAMNAYFAARLASQGITGPPDAIEGHRGLWALATGAFDLSRLGVPQDGRWAVERTNYKLFVAEYNSQGPVGVFVDLHREGVRPESVASIAIRTYEVAWSEIGGGQNDHDIKWDPTNKETADHSLPYMVAVALADGEVTADSYRLDRVTDPALRPLMRKISVEPDEAITRTWVAEPAHAIDIVFTNGERLSLRVSYPRGHYQNPATDEDLVAKYRLQVEPLLGASQSEALLETLWSLPKMATVNDLASRYRTLAIAP